MIKVRNVKKKSTSVLCTHNPIPALTLTSHFLPGPTRVPVVSAWGLNGFWCRLLSGLLLIPLLRHIL